MVALIVAAMVAMACTDGEPTGPPGPPPNPDLVSAEIGPEGGTLTSASGTLTLEFPPGALQSTETITVERLDPDELGPEFDELRNELSVTHAWELGPDGLQFAEPVEFVIASDQSPVRGDSLVAKESLFFISEGEEAIPLDSTQVVVDGEAGTVVTRGRLDHFSQGVNFGPVISPIRPPLASVSVPAAVPTHAHFAVDARVNIRADDIAEVLTATYIDRSIGEARTTMVPPRRTMPKQPDGFRALLPYVCTEVGPDKIRPTIKMFRRYKRNKREFLTVYSLLEPLECTEPESQGLTDDQVAGTYDVHYSGGSGCGQQVDPFTELAQVAVVPQGGGHLVEIDFPNGPLLNGDIDLTTGSFMATTGRVDISEDQEAEETYEDGNFQAGDAGQNTSFTATSTFIIYDKATGEEVCQLTIPVSGEKQ